ncbi:unnamed protein product [Chondrus crispus]|uniref:Uncharacterized protein n=1 Tax=Chondrus crispus TaxID=2769 RepID=R7QHR9_CHOCR|nr:unnamed protein product [Chondrus crispus]CDF37624.1 unnamed protein product [Chondrus crispus]|eukprot:XP_005717495.1 unnamed protein product [Chondrus crispus]
MIFSPCPDNAKDFLLLFDHNCCSFYFELLFYFERMSRRSYITGLKWVLYG